MCTLKVTVKDHEKSKKITTFVEKGAQKKCFKKPE